MSDDLIRYRPILRLDSRERLASPGEGTVPGTALKRADRRVIAVPPLLTLTTLAEHEYAGWVDAQRLPVQPGDHLEHPSLPCTVYGREASQKGKVFLTYWLWFARDRSHQGDWESIALEMGADGPVLAAYAQHRSGERRPWADVEKEGDRPVVYVARGSHAGYFRSGTYVAPSWRSVNFANGKQREDPAMQVIDQSTPWALWPGRWGATGELSPIGPGHHQAWRDAGGWMAKVAAEPLSHRLPALP